MGRKWSIVVKTTEGRVHFRDGDLNDIVDVLLEPTYEVEKAHVFPSTRVPLDVFLRRVAEHGPLDTMDDADKIDRIRAIANRMKEGENAQ